MDPLLGISAARGAGGQMPSKSPTSTSALKLLIQLIEVTKQKDTGATTNTLEFAPLWVQFLGYG